MNPDDKLRRELLEQAMELERQEREAGKQWLGEERRDQRIASEWQWLHTELHAIKAQGAATHMTIIELKNEYAALRKDFDAHIKEEEKAFKAIRAAFPNDDFQGHLRYHEMLIERDKEERETLKDFKRKLYVSGGWGALVFLGLAVWEWIKGHLK